MSSSSEYLNKNNVILDFLKALIVAMLISFGLVILLAFSLKWFSLPDSTIYPLNMAIKLLSVVVGATIAVKGESKGLVKGVGFGVFYIIAAFLIFSGLAKSFQIDTSLFLDLIFSAIAGGIIGIIKVNKK